MSDEKNDITQAQQLILALNEARQKEIESVRSRMEDFLKGQLDLQHKMEIVAEGQKALKERFEEGVSKRLTGLDAKMDKFLIEWGSKQKEDQLRDERLSDVKKKAEDAEKKSNDAIDSAAFYGKWILISVLAGLALGGLAMIFPRLHG